VALVLIGLCTKAVMGATVLVGSVTQLNIISDVTSINVA